MDVCATVVAAVVIVEVMFVLSNAITGSEGTANSTVQAATFSVNGVISYHVPVMVIDWPLSIGTFEGVIDTMLKEVAPASVAAIKAINKTAAIEVPYLI